MWIRDASRTRRGAVVRSRLHLHPDVELVRGEGSDQLVLRVGGRDVTVRGSAPLFLEPGRCSRRFGERRETRIVVQHHVPGDGDGESAQFTIDVPPRRTVA